MIEVLIDYSIPDNAWRVKVLKDGEYTKDDDGEVLTALIKDASELEPILENIVGGV